MTKEKRLEAIKGELEKLNTIENLKETIENLITLHEVQAPLEDIDAAIIEARRALDNLFQDNS
jgi:hypothetical protein